ncbi:hypothetical protein EXW94_26140 [Enterobacter sp. JMULE2]|uniref:hypothetical protein n=1 Tax=Enterobacter sp. JMULE2 TaxID=2518340 RepID=UPI0015766B2B|nr:hypothetical protein [Enterobacter sp. JMULE2]NTZ41081.1 hypothetical protein [Enterobacter sp. JMULE2]
MSKLKWPEGSVMSANCPGCQSVVNVQIETVKEMGLYGRPDECSECGCAFDLDHTGKTTRLFAHPTEITEKGLLLLEQDFVFDPAGE